MDSAWPQCLSRLEAELPADEVHTWLRPLQAETHEGRLTLYAPNAFVVETVRERYLARIRELLAHFASGATVALEVGSLQRAVAPSAHTLGARASGDHGYASNLDPHYTFETFVEGRSNQLGRIAAMQAAQKPGDRAHNPLLLYGGTGLGKTHLMSAAGNLMRQNNPGVKVLYLRSEQFFSAMMKALAEKAMDQFKRQFHTVDALLIDDIQFFAGKDRTQEEFFHIFNALHDTQKQIVISSDCPPRQIPTLEERLHSRFEWGLIADIQPPDIETKVAILRKKAEAERVEIPENVALFIASKVRTNIRELEGSLIRLIAYASLTGRDIDLGLAQEVLRDLLQTEDKPITVEMIQKLVADHYNVKLADLKAKNNSKSVAEPRQIAMYLTKTLTNSSLPEIGKVFGGKHHSTVIHSVRKIDTMRKRDPEFDRLINSFVQAFR